jgi:hypothetical protein
MKIRIQMAATDRARPVWVPQVPGRWVSLDTFRSVMQPWVAFEVIDRDKSGTLDRKELKALMWISKGRDGWGAAICGHTAWPDLTWGLGYTNLDLTVLLSMLDRKELKALMWISKGMYSSGI